VCYRWLKTQSEKKDAELKEITQVPLITKATLKAEDSCGQRPRHTTSRKYQREISNQMLTGGDKTWRKTKKVVDYEKMENETGMIGEQ